MTVIINYRHILCKAVIQLFSGITIQHKIII